MNDCLTAETLERYRDGRLNSPREFAEIGAHLAGCPACSETLRKMVLGAAPALYAGLLPEEGEAECLDEALIEGYARGELSDPDTEVVEAHIALCAACREDVASLAEFHREMQAYDGAEAGAGGWWARMRDRAAGWGASVETHVSPLRALAAWNRLSLSTRILVALILGALTGFALGSGAVGLQEVNTAVLHLLGAVAYPLIFIAIVHALMRTELTGRSARRLGWLLASNSLAAVTIGALVATIAHPGADSLLIGAHIAASPLVPGPGSLLEPIASSSLVLILCAAIGLGFAMRTVREEQIRDGQSGYRTLEEILETLFRCLLHMLNWIIALVPVAVFAGAAALVGARNFAPVRSLGGFVLTVLLALALQAGYYLLRLRFGSSIRAGEFLRGARSALLTAFSTASSAAAMPVSYSRVRDRLAVREEAASLGVFVGGTLNRDGTALFEVMAVLFLTRALGIHMGAGQQIAAVFLTLIASICAPGIPEAGLVTMTLVFHALGLSQAAPYIVLLLPVDWFLDRCRTLINVMGHITVACLIDGHAPRGARRHR